MATPVALRQVANDDAGIFQPSLNALYGHPAADRVIMSGSLATANDPPGRQSTLHIAQDIYSPSGANKRA